MIDIFAAAHTMTMELPPFLASTSTFSIGQAVFVVAFVVHLLMVAGLSVRRGHPTWLAIAFGLLPLIGLAGALFVGDQRSIRQSEEEAAALAAAASRNDETSTFILRAILLFGLLVSVSMLAERANIRADLTASQRYSIDPLAETLMQEVSRRAETLRVRYYYSPRASRPQRLATLDREIDELLAEYSRSAGTRMQYALYELPATAGEEEDEDEDDASPFGDMADDDGDTAEDGADSEGGFSDPDARRRELLREVNELGIEPISETVSTGGGSDTFRFYSAFHLSYGSAGEATIDDVYVSREESEAGKRVVDQANWQLARSIIQLLDDAFGETEPLRPVAFDRDGRVRFSGVAGFHNSGDTVAVPDGDRRFTVQSINAEGRTVTVVRANPEEGESTEPRTIRVRPSFQHTVGFLAVMAEGEGRSPHDEAAAAAFRNEMLAPLGIESEMIYMPDGEDPVPAGIEVLVVVPGSEPLPDGVRYRLDQYLLQGGRILLTYSPLAEPRARVDSSWLAFTQPYGLAFASPIQDPDTPYFVFDNRGVRIRSRNLYLPLAVQLLPDNLTSHPIASSVSVRSDPMFTPESRAMLFAGGAQPAESMPEGVTYESVLTTSSEGYLVEATQEIINDPFGFDGGGGRVNPALQAELRVRREPETNLRRIDLIARAVGTFPSAFAGQDAPTITRTEMPPMPAEGELPQTQPSTTEIALGGPDRLASGIAPGQIIVYGSRYGYPNPDVIAIREFVFNAILAALPDGDRMIALKAKTTVYPPIERDLSEADRSWFTQVALLVVPIGLFLTALLIYLSDRRSQTILRSFRPARGRIRAGEAVIAQQDVLFKRARGILYIGMAGLLTGIMILGWHDQPGMANLWLVGLVLALPVLGYGLIGLAASPSFPALNRFGEPTLDPAITYRLVLIGLATIAVVAGILLAAGIYLDARSIAAINQADELLAPSHLPLLYTSLGVGGVALILLIALYATIETVGAVPRDPADE